MSNVKTFASAADLEVKKVSFDKLSDHAYAYTAEGDPNTGIIIGDDAVMVIDTQATPVMAQDVIRRIREVTDKPIQYVLLSHYHAVRVLGASAYGAEHIIASEDTRDLIVERGQFDKDSEIGRFPRLFQNVESVPPGLTITPPQVTSDPGGNAVFSIRATVPGIVTINGTANGVTIQPATINFTP